MIKPGQKREKQVVAKGVTERRVCPQCQHLTMITIIEDGYGNEHWSCPVCGRLTSYRVR